MQYQTPPFALGKSVIQHRRRIQHDLKPCAVQCRNQPVIEVSVAFMAAGALGAERPR